MQKIFISFFIFLITTSVFSQTAATDFTCNDCSGNSHTLFSELNAGKVIVMCWVMPCATCIPPASTDASVVQGYASSNPGMVKFYLVDDYANTTCTSLNSWASTNGITYDASFSNAAISMSNYGSAGMPKTVVLGGGTCHTIYYNQNGSVSSSALQAAINNALTACTAIGENPILDLSFQASPNPATRNVTVRYELEQASTVSLEIMNLLGENMFSMNIGNEIPGKQEHTINLEGFTAGFYFIKLQAGPASLTRKITIIR